MSNANNQERKVYAPASKKQEMFLNSKTTITIAGGAAGCFDSWTEFLSDKGWVKFSEYQQGLKVAQYNPETDTISFVEPLQYVKEQSTGFKRVNSPNVDICQTENHKTAYLSGDEFKVIPWGAVLTAKNDIKPRIKTSFSNVDNVDNEDILNESTVRFSVSHGIYSDKLWKCSDKFLKFVVEEIKYCNCKDGVITYKSTDKCLIDFMQYALHANGYIANINKYENEYRLIGYESSSALLDISKHEIEDYQGDGFMYCFEVPTGFLLVRRSNKVYISGNSGKSYTSLLIALKFMQHPRATGVIFRRTSKMLTAPGSLWQEAIAMYSDIYKTGLRIREGTNEIIFPNGAVLKFSHMQYENNKYDHKGGQYSLVIFDEATDFSESQVIYLLSRMRNAYVDYQPQMFMMTNPDYDSFIRSWIQDHYLDSDGIPIPERTGDVRYFYRQGDKMHWANSEEELKEQFGDSISCTSFTFIGANCMDNPPLLKADPTYKDRLLALPDVEVKRLFWGSWFARPEAAGLWKREWCPIVQYPNTRARKRVRSWDIAGSLPSPAYPDPDWTRGVLVSKDETGVYAIEDLKSLRDRFQRVEELIFSTAVSDGIGTIVVLPADPNAQAGAWARGMQRRLAEMGYTCRLVRPNLSKGVRFAPFSSIAQSGFMYVVDSDWYNDFCVELENFDPGNRKIKDDIVDACSDAIFILNKDTTLPNFSLPSLGDNSNSFGIQSIDFSTGLAAKL